MASKAKAVLEKIKEFIKKILQPILKRFDNSSEENGNEIINALTKVGIKVDASTDGKTKYNPLIYKKTDDGKHTIRSILLTILAIQNWVPDIYKIEEALIKAMNNIQSLNNNQLSVIFSKQETNSDVYENWVIEDYVEKSYHILDLCIQMQNIILGNENIDANSRSMMLNKILSFSNQLNIFLILLHKAVSIKLNPITKEVVNQFEDVNHIAKFVETYTKSPKINYIALRNALIKIFKFSKYKYGVGSSRIYIPDPEDSSYGYKFATNPKGIMDNKMEYQLWGKISGSKLSEFFVPILEIADSGMIIKCKKASNVGRVSRSKASKMLSSIKSIQKSFQSGDLKASFDADILIKPYMFASTDDSVYNAGNVGLINNVPVIIDYANVFV